MSLHKVTWLLAILVSAAGCQTQGVRGDTAKVTPAQAATIAADWSDYVATRYPAADTTFNMAPPQTRGPVGQALESMLRNNGFAIAYTDPQANGETLTIESATYDQGGLVVVSLRIAPGTLVSRAYSVRPDGVTPSSARTQQLEAPHE